MWKEVDTERRVAAVAARQHGVLTTAQLNQCGVSGATITRWVRWGRLHRLYRGVYAVGHRGLSEEGRLMAALLASGEGAVLSHASAAALWTFLLPVRGPIDVTVPTAAGRRARRGIRLHRCASLRRTEVSRRHGIAVTTPARTVADLPGTLEPRLVRRARRQAELFGGLRLEAPSDRTRSDLERDFLRFCRRYGLPRPEVNFRIGEWTVDFVWPTQRVAVETDHLAYHRGDVSFDHELELDLRLAGYAFQRVTGRQLDRAPDKLARTLRGLLGLPSAAFPDG